MIGCSWSCESHAVSHVSFLRWRERQERKGPFAFLPWHAPLASGSLFIIPGLQRSGWYLSGVSTFSSSTGQLGQLFEGLHFAVSLPHPLPDSHPLALFALPPGGSKSLNYTTAPRWCRSCSCRGGRPTGEPRDSGLATDVPGVDGAMFATAATWGSGHWALRGRTWSCCEELGGLMISWCFGWSSDVFYMFSICFFSYEASHTISAVVSG